MKSSVRIGIDGEGLRLPLTGVGQYLYKLCVELERILPNAKFHVYARLGADALALPSSRWVLRREPLGWLRRLPSFLWLRTRGSRMCRRDALDVFWAGRTLHAGRSAARRTVVTVHDFNHRIVPETMERATRWSHELWFDRDVRSADAVMVNSAGTGQRLQQMYERQADAVIRPGLSPSFKPAVPGQIEPMRQALADLGVTPPYLLAVSTLEPRKNMEALLDAFVGLRLAGHLPRHQLVLVGARGWKNRALAQKVRDAAPMGVVLPGYIDDSLLPAVYALADLLVMPSIYEGFGMPVLEARSMGTPVLVSDIPELREAAGEGGFVAGTSVEAIAAGILLALQTERRPASPLAPEDHAWEHAARRVAAVLVPDRVAARPPDHPLVEVDSPPVC